MYQRIPPHFFDVSCLVYLPDVNLSTDVLYFCNSRERERERERDLDYTQNDDLRTTAYWTSSPLHSL